MWTVETMMVGLHFMQLLTGAKKKSADCWWRTCVTCRLSIKWWVLPALSDWLRAPTLIQLSSPGLWTPGAKLSSFKVRMHWCTTGMVPRCKPQCSWVIFKCTPSPTAMGFLDSRMKKSFSFLIIIYLLLIWNGFCAWLFKSFLIPGLVTSLCKDCIDCIRLLLIQFYDLTKTKCHCYCKAKITCYYVISHLIINRNLRLCVFVMCYQARGCERCILS